MGVGFDRWFHKTALPKPASLREAVRRHYLAFGFDVRDLEADLLVRQPGVVVLVRLITERQTVEADVSAVVTDALHHQARRAILFVHDISDPARRAAAAAGVELVGPDSIRRMLQASPAA